MEARNSMAFQAAPAIVQTTIEGRVDGQLTVNDLFWFATGAITSSTIASLVNILASWVVGSYAPLLSRDWTASRIRGFDLSTPIGAQNEIGVIATGGVDVEAAPNNVAACVSIRTAQRGRSGRGRNFVPAIPNSIITLNTLDPAWMTDMLNAYNGLVGAGSFVAGYEWVVLSRVTGGVPRASGIGIPVTQAVFVGNSVRSMRSREIGHGA
jgi:hypothetical protein